jgi:apolipoprotein N-acyltransferase
MAEVAVGTERVAVAEAAGPGGARRALLAAVGGLMLAASFPNLELAPLAWIGLVPILLAARGLRPRRAFAVGWFGGFVFFMATVYWVATTIVSYTAVPFPLAVAILILMNSILALYHGAFVAGLAWLDRRRLPSVWLAPPLWVTLEWLRGWFVIGFGWAGLGYSQYRFHDLVQMAEVTGVYGVSAVLVLFNAVVTAVVAEQGRRVRRLVPALLVTSALVVGLPLAGRMRAAAVAARPPVGTLTVALVQGNVEQDHKWDPAYQKETTARYRELTLAAAGERPALVVWPETATPFFFQERGPYRDDLLALAGQADAFLLFGSPAYRRLAQGGFEEFNRAYLVSPAGREVDSYDKIELVPFGEYVPFRRILFFVDQIVHAIGTVVPGVVPTVFQVPGARFGALICYEGIFPALTRRFVVDGADFLVNITNDAWYGRTSAPRQHLAHATLRAVENRVPLVRAANTGISAIIDPDGRIRWEGPLFEPLWRVERIAWPGVRTFYTARGDVFVYACVLASLAAFGYGAWRARRDAADRSDDDSGAA